MSQEIAEDFERRFDVMIAAVEKALHDIHANRIPDMRTIDQEVAILCKKVETAPADVAHRIQPLMGQMISRLDELAQALNDFKQKVAGGQH